MTEAADEEAPTEAVTTVAATEEAPNEAVATEAAASEAPAELMAARAPLERLSADMRRSDDFAMLKITAKQRDASQRSYYALIQFLGDSMKKISSCQDQLLGDRMTLRNMSPEECRVVVVPSNLDARWIWLQEEQAKMSRQKLTVFLRLQRATDLWIMDHPEGKV
jgi:hypothetical protein